VPWEKQFDRAVALKRAQHLFWKSGYEKSSLSALLRAMGIQKGSFYATFKSKRHVFLEALKLYIEERFAAFEALTDRGSPIAALHSHLDEVVAESTGPDRAMGCFLVNCATEIAPRDRAVRDVVEATLQGHAKFYERLLAQAKRAGELPATFDVGVHASALLGLVLGMRVMARGGASARTIRHLREQAEMLLVNRG
jgi:TetR/AcrR family transcriptional regulator, transcriptional repressor for nem operon